MEESDDRFSKLPDSLIFYILSFLSMRDVVSTTLLSKRWKYLWTTTPYLNFCEYIISNGDDDDDDVDDRERVRNFVNRVLIFWKGIKILKFTINFVSEFDSTSLDSDIDRWVRLAVENRVEELKLRTRGHFTDDYMFPHCLNSCSWLRKLSLFGCNIREIGYPPAWNQLKSLKIVGANFYERPIDQTLLGTPQLEVFELRVSESHENLNIRSVSLKRLLVKKCAYASDEPSPDNVVGIFCPNLEILEISGVVYKCLLTDMPYLTDATLGFHDPWVGRHNELLGETLREILPTIQHAEKLTLSVWCVEVLCVLRKKHLLSPLPNVKILKLYVDGIIDPDGMMGLLRIIPNLKMFVVIEHPDFFDSYIYVGYDFDERSSMSFGRNVSESLGKGELDELLNIRKFKSIRSKSFLLQLKTIEITSNLSDTSIFRLIASLLKHATILEKLVVRAKRRVRCAREVNQRLMSMPRSSPTVKVFFKKK